MKKIKDNSMLMMLIIVFVFFAILTHGSILLPMNISSLISQNAYVFILATGMLLCILTGGNIDLSVGSVVCFVGSVGAVLMNNFGMNVILVIIIMLLLGLAIGAFQGFWIAYIRIPAFIVTLAGMLAFRGLSNIVLSGKTIPITDNKLFLNLFGGGSYCYISDFFSNSTVNITCILAGILVSIIYIICKYVLLKHKKIAKELILKDVLIVIAIMGIFTVLAFHKGIPTVLIWVGIVVLIYGIITEHTTIGRHFYAVGSNEKAAFLSGIKTNRVYFIAYANMGVLSALAGMLTIARLTSANSTYGMNYEMDAIAACFIGGASASGGVGKVQGVIIGALLMGIINMGMSLLGLDQNLQKVVKGIVLLVAVIFDVASKRGKFIC